MVLPQATMLKINLIVLRLKLQVVMFLADPSYADCFSFFEKNMFETSSNSPKRVLWSLHHVAVKGTRSVSTSPCSPAHIASVILTALVPIPFSVIYLMPTPAVWLGGQYLLIGRSTFWNRD